MSSTTLARLRGFLICVPKPASVRLFVDGEPHELKINSNHRGYTKLAETIEAMQGEQLQCLDDKGNVLRAMRLDERAASKRPSSDAVPVPPQLVQDPQAAMVMLFANLLHRAYKHSTQVAFARLGEITDRVIDRMGQIEQRLDREEAYARRLQEEQTEETIDHAHELANLTAAAAAGGGGDDALMGQLFQAWMSGRAQRGAAPGAAAPNGAAKPNGASTSNGAKP